MNSKDSIGKAGEEAAAEYLKKLGYPIIERNYRRKFGELDIVAKDPDGTLVFVEVKTLRGSRNSETALTPEDNMSRSKMNKTQRIAQMFAAKHPEYINERRGWRIDLVAIDVIDDEFNIRHYKNIDI